MTNTPARRSKASPLPQDAPERNAERRAKIARALDACIRDKGYSATSLTDIALRARMSPSHIRYYFDGKEEILEYYLGATCKSIMEEIGRIPRNSPQQWLDNFTAYFIANPVMTQASIGVLLEIFAAAIHNPRLAKIKAHYDEFIRKTFLDFFAWSGCANGLTTDEAAYTAWSLEVGMKFKTVFQDDLSPSRAGDIFQREMRRMAGLPPRTRVKRREKLS